MMSQKVILVLSNIFSYKFSNLNFDCNTMPWRLFDPFDIFSMLSQPIIAPNLYLINVHTKALSQSFDSSKGIAIT